LLDIGPVYGLFLVTGNAMLAEATGHAGFSRAVVDMEGAAVTRVDALHQVQALTAAVGRVLCQKPRTWSGLLFYARRSC
jgi:2-keto-3-deoxy-L-rhamnonate aldolase RhmA